MIDMANSVVSRARPLKPFQRKGAKAQRTQSHSTVPAEKFLCVLCAFALNNPGLY
jgi:hypothetical protein